MFAAQELKNSILQLAIRGKLVEQRPEEGTAEELYRRIQSEKAKLLKAGKIKKEKPLPEITEDEIPFEIPETWKWVRLGECTNYGQSKIKIKATDISPDTWSLDLEDIEKETGRIIARIPAQKRKIIGDKVVFHKGEILYSKLRPYLKKILIADNDGICSSEIVPFTQYSNIATLYLLYFLKSPHVDYVINSVTYGVKMPRVGSDTMLNLLVPLPPLEEQKRIVAKIEEIFPYIERFGELRSQLKNISEDLRKSILQQAILGKLVEQRPEEGTAEELYKQNQSEKAKLLKAGKIKKEKPLPEISEDEIPFEIPETWKWVRLGELTQFQGGYAFKSNSYVSHSNNQVIRLGNVKPNNLLIGEKQIFIPDDIAEIAIDYKLKENDILVTMTGTRRKRDYFFTHAISAKDIAARNLYLNQRVGCLRTFSRVDIKYLLLVLQNENIRDLIFAKETGTANQGNIGSEDMKQFVLIPLPPLEEQKRIVSKIEELLKLCDKLK